MRKRDWGTTGNAVYELHYHFVWSVKYRRRILCSPVDQLAKRVLSKICKEKGLMLLGLEVMQDHIHIFLSAPPRMSPSTIAKWLRGQSAYEIFKAYPELKHQLWKGHLWNPSYYVGTAGHVSSETICRTIDRQKTRDW